MILPNGRYCLIRDVYVEAAQGDLVVEAEIWRDEADFRAFPDRPREAHDHRMWLFDPKAGKRRPVTERDNLQQMIMNVLVPCMRDDRHVAIIKHRRHAGDPLGFLSHPHVKALEIVPR